MFLVAGGQAVTGRDRCFAVESRREPEGMGEGGNKGCRHTDTWLK